MIGALLGFIQREHIMTYQDYTIAWYEVCDIVGARNSTQAQQAYDWITYDERPNAYHHKAARQRRQAAQRAAARRIKS